VAVLTLIRSGIKNTFGIFVYSTEYKFPIFLLDDFFYVAGVPCGLENDPNADLKSPISLVHEIALKRNLPVNFEVVSEKGPPHMRTFVTKCTVGDRVTTGEGNGKKVYGTCLLLWSYGVHGKYKSMRAVCQLVKWNLVQFSLCGTRSSL
jgi:hypothetical protein